MTDALVPSTEAGQRIGAQEREQALLKLAQQFEVDAPSGPLQLSQDAQDAIAGLMKLRGAANTQRSYETGLRLFAAWYLLTYRRPPTLPFPTEAVAHFVADYAEGEGRKRSDTHEAVDEALVRAGYKASPGPLLFATLKQRLAAITSLHAEHNFTSPTAAPAIKLLMKAARVQAKYAGRLRPRKKAPLLRDDILAMSEVETGGPVVDLRDRALVLFGFASGGRRRSEIAAACWEHLTTRTVDGALAFDYELQDGKRLKHPKKKPVRGAAAVALKAWADAVRDQSPDGKLEGPIFRRIYGSRIMPEGLSGLQVARIVKKRAGLAGIELDIGAHSLRRGFITEGHRQGRSPKDMMDLTDHTSVQTYFDYIETDVHTNPASDVLGSGSPKE